MIDAIFIIFGVTILGLAGGILSRMCGGARPHLGSYDQWLYAVPYFFIIIWATTYYDPLTYMAAGVAYLIAVAGKRTGHGGGMDLGHSPKEPYAGRQPEKLEYLILWLHGRIPTYWYDALLLALTGLLVTAPAGIVVAMINPIAGGIIILSGAAKTLAYMIGWKIYPQGQGNSGSQWGWWVENELDEATEIGEFLTGFFAFAALNIAGLILALDIGVK